jgi:hypothetical protein
VAGSPTGGLGSPTGGFARRANTTYVQAKEPNESAHSQFKEVGALVRVPVPLVYAAGAT